MAGGLGSFDFSSLPTLASGSADDFYSPNLGLPRDAPAPSSLSDAIGTIPAQYGIDPDYIRKMATAESGGNLNAKAATSSAAGPYQIIGSTADSLGLARADRYDPVKATQAISQFTADNAAGLQKSGFDPTHGALYLSHFAGLGGAKSVLGADPATPVSQILPSSSIAVNPFLRGMSAGDLTAWADRKMSGAPMQMPASAGGAAKPAGFSVSGVTQGAAPAAGATMATPQDQAPPAVPDSFTSAIRSLSGMGGKAGGQSGHGQGRQDDEGGAQPFALQPFRPRRFSLLQFASMLPGDRQGGQR